jgi:hypothetical protein
MIMYTAMDKARRMPSCIKAKPNID